MIARVAVFSVILGANPLGLNACPVTVISVAAEFSDVLLICIWVAARRDNEKPRIRRVNVAAWNRNEFDKGLIDGCLRTPVRITDKVLFMFLSFDT